MNATFPCYEDPESPDATDRALREQLRSMYRWIDGAAPGEPNVKIVCRPASPPPVLVEHVKAAAAQLQEQIATRAAEEATRVAS